MRIVLISIHLLNANDSDLHWAFWVRIVRIIIGFVECESLSNPMGFLNANYLHWDWVSWVRILRIIIGVSGCIWFAFSSCMFACQIVCMFAHFGVQPSIDYCLSLRLYCAMNPDMPLERSEKPSEAFLAYPWRRYYPLPVNGVVKNPSVFNSLRVSFLVYLVMLSNPYAKSLVLGIIGTLVFAWRLCYAHVRSSLLGCWTRR